MKMLVTLLFISLVSLTLCSNMNNCPDPNDGREKLTADSSSVKMEYEKTKTEEEKRTKKEIDLTPDPKTLSTMEWSDKCQKPKFPEDKPKKGQHSLATRAIFLPRKCEPCPSREYFLRRFYGSCYVIGPQRVRFVRCNTRCFAPCMCSNSYCRRTAWFRIWFFSYCFGFRGQRFPGGYRAGLNYRYLWAPQCCTCVNV